MKEPDRLSTGFEEKELLDIKCDFCNNTGAVKDGDKWVDCAACIHRRIEAKSRLQKIVPVPTELKKEDENEIEMKEGKPVIIATEKGPVALE